MCISSCTTSKNAHIPMFFFHPSNIFSFTNPIPLHISSIHIICSSDNGPIISRDTGHLLRDSCNCLYPISVMITTLFRLIASVYFSSRYCPSVLYSSWTTLVLEYKSKYFVLNQKLADCIRFNQQFILAKNLNI
jgi:hypothetical protein